MTGKVGTVDIFTAADGVLEARVVVRVAAPPLNKDPILVIARELSSSEEWVAIKIQDIDTGEDLPYPENGYEFPQSILEALKTEAKKLKTSQH